MSKLTDKIRFLLACCLSGVLIAGCKSEATMNAEKAAAEEEKIVTTLVDLMELQNIIHNFDDIEKHFPGSWQEAAEFAKKNDMASGVNPTALDRLQSLGYTVEWGKSLSKLDTYDAVASCPGNFTLMKSGIDSPESWPNGWSPTTKTKARLRAKLGEYHYGLLNFGN